MMARTDGTLAPAPRTADAEIRGRRDCYRERRCATFFALLASVWVCLPATGGFGAEPCVRSLAPDQGPTAGGIRVGVMLADRIDSEDVEVRFGERTARVLARVGTTLDVEAPAHPPGAVSVRVVSGACAVEADGPRFTYLAPPRLVSVRPVDPTAAGDLTVEAVGSDFGPSASLLVDGTPVPTERKEPERIHARIPAALLGTARHMTLQILDPTRGLSDGVTMTLANPAPRLVSIQAPPLRAGRARTIIGLVGRDFRSASAARLDGKPLDTRLRSDSYLEAVLPADALDMPGTRTISVVTAGPGGGESAALELQVLPPAPFGGHFVVFMSNRRGGRNHIFLLDRQTGKLDPLDQANSLDASDGYPSISADGRFIAFQSDRHRGQSDILLFDRENRTLDLLPEANDPTAFDGFPSVSPDGRFIVFESDRLYRKPKVYLFDLETRRLTELSAANEVAADDGVAAISN